jgi:hypothetical protein
MKKLVFAFLFLLLSVRASFAQPPPPPPGMMWQPTFDDPFVGTALDTSKWSAELWCYGGTCPLAGTGVTVGGGEVKLQGHVDYPSCTNNYSVNISTKGKFSQRFGYFEFNYRPPTDVAGEGTGWHEGVWGVANGNGVVGGCPGAAADEEVDVAEQWIAPGALDWTNFTMHDCAAPTTQSYGGVGDRSAANHLYGLLWSDDGSSSQGSMQVYLDGVPQGSKVVLKGTSVAWANGIWLNASSIADRAECANFTAKSSNSNPVHVAHVTAWKLVPVIPTPTPTSTSTPTPTATPTPTGCTADISALNGQTVSSPVTIAPVVNGCGMWPSSGGFVRFELTSPFPAHFDGASGTSSVSVALGNGSYSGYVSLWANSVTPLGSRSGSISFTVGPAPTPTPPVPCAVACNGNVPTGTCHSNCTFSTP